MATITTVSVEPMSGQAANLKDSPYTFHDVSTTGRKLNEPVRKWEVTWLPWKLQRSGKL